MLSLRSNERVLAAIHPHWIVLAQKMTSVVLLLLGAVASLLIYPLFDINPVFSPLSFYLLLVYLLIVLLIAFVLWMNYYLDVWIVTTERIVDVDQKSAFRREVSEFLLASVQDVTVEIPGLAATLLHYGTIRVETAGEQTFVAEKIPNVDAVKNIILSESQKAKSSYGRTF